MTNKTNTTWINISIIGVMIYALIGFFIALRHLGLTLQAWMQNQPIPFEWLMLYHVPIPIAIAWFAYLFFIKKWSFGLKERKKPLKKKEKIDNKPNELDESIILFGGAGGAS